MTEVLPFFDELAPRRRSPAGTDPRRRCSHRGFPTAKPHNRNSLTTLAAVSSATSIVILIFPKLSSARYDGGSKWYRRINSSTALVLPFTQRFLAVGLDDLAAQTTTIQRNCRACRS